MAQSNWQAPLEQPSTIDYDAAWEAEAAGAEAEIQASMPEAAPTNIVAEDGDVFDTSSSCDLSYAASEVDGVSDCTEGAEEYLAPVNSVQTNVATTIQEGTAERGEHAAATRVTEVVTAHLEQLTLDLSSTAPSVCAGALVESPVATESEVHYLEVLVREDPVEEQTLPALHSALQVALRGGPAAETGVSPSAEADRNPVGEAAQINAASYPSAFDDRPSAACLALLPVPSGTHSQTRDHPRKSQQQCDYLDLV